LIGILFTAASAGIGAEVQLELVGQIGGATYAVAVRDGYAYIGVGPRMVILDVSDPHQLSVVGQTEVLPDVVQDVEVAGGYAYVADGKGGLLIIDVSDPTSPQKLSFYDTPIGSAIGVAVWEHYAYVAAHDYFAPYMGVLWIIDVRDPAFPQEVGSCDIPGYAWDVTVKGNYAYVTDETGLRIIDVSDPTSPQELGFYDILEYALGVAVKGDYAYVAAHVGGLRIIDVSDPTSPQEIGSCDTPGNSRHVMVVGDYAYVADGFGGVRIIDVSDPFSPQEVSSCGTSGYAWNVVVMGNNAYVAGGAASLGRALSIIDVSDPFSPKELGHYDTPGDAHGIAVVGDYAYVAEGYPNMWGALWIIDVRDPASPQEVSFCATPDDAWDVVVKEDYAYIAGREILSIIDVSDPASPQEVGSWDTLGVARDVAVKGNYAYVVFWFEGLRIIDVSDPTFPHEVGFCETTGAASGVAVVGNYAYVADGFEGLRIIDVSDPTSPQEVGSCDTPGHAWDVVVMGNYAYVADREGGLRVIDVSNPTSPQEVGSYDMLEYTWDIAVAGDYVCVADGPFGLIILRFESAEYFGCIHGRVTDVATGQGIAGATVEAQGPIVGPQAKEPKGKQAPFSTVTDEFGNYSLELPEGVYDIRASAEGYEPQVIGVTVTAGETVELNFELTPTAPVNRVPIARATDISGQPGTMYPGVSYTVSARYFDPDGREDLKYCYLRLNHPEKPLTIMWYQEDGHAAPWAGEEGENYLTELETVVTEITDATTGYEGYQITWLFRINDRWPETEGRINFGVFATDDSEMSSGWDYDTTGASFVVQIEQGNLPPVAFILHYPQDIAGWLVELLLSGHAPIYETGEKIVFNGFLSTDLDGEIVTYSWDFDDGTTASGKVVSHSYNVPGIYNVSLTVEDNDGATYTDEATVYVLPPDEETVGRFKALIDRFVQQAEGILESDIKGGSQEIAEAVDYFLVSIPTDAFDFIFPIISGILPSKLVKDSPLWGYLIKDLTGEAVSTINESLLRAVFEALVTNPNFLYTRASDEVGRRVSARIGELEDARAVVNEIDELVREGTLTATAIKAWQEDIAKRMLANLMMGNYFFGQAMLLGTLADIKQADEESWTLRLGRWLWTFSFALSKGIMSAALSPIVGKAAGLLALASETLSRIEALASDSQMFLLGHYMLRRAAFLESTEFPKNFLSVISDNVLEALEKLQAGEEPRTVEGTIESVERMDKDRYRVTIRNTGTIPGRYFLIGMYQKTYTSYELFQGVGRYYELPTYMLYPIDGEGWDLQPGGSVTVEVELPEEATELWLNLLGANETGIFGLDTRCKVIERESWINQFASWWRGTVGSPVEFGVYDAEGRFTGIRDGAVYREIPNSIYDDENNSIWIASGSDFAPLKGLELEVKGLEQGTYDLKTEHVWGAAQAEFRACGIPVSSGAVHRYEADWEALAAGQPGVTASIDSNGDGEVEEEISVGPILEGVPVPSGSNVSVEFPEQQVALTFEKVITPGHAFVSIVEALPFQEISGLQFVSDFYSFEVTAETEGLITIQLMYDDSDLSPTEEANLRLYKITQEGKVFDITTSLDSEHNRIFGVVESLSYFGIGLPVCSSLGWTLGPVGWHMLTLPGELCEPCTYNGCGDVTCALCDDLEGCFIFYWDPAAGHYVMAPPPENICYHQGMGFWVRTYGPDVEVDAEVMVPSGPVEVPLKDGWNMIGDPFPLDVPLSSLKVRHGEQELSLLDAQQQGWVSAYLFGYNPEQRTYVMLDPANGLLEAWHGYWMKAYVDCTLVIPPEGTGEPVPAAQVASLPSRKRMEPPPPPSLLPLSAQLRVVPIPNPVRDVHTATFRVPGICPACVEGLKVEIFDLAGRVVWRGEVKGPFLEWHTRGLDGLPLANGVYLYKAYVKVDGEWIPTGVGKVAILR